MIRHTRMQSTAVLRWKAALCGTAVLLAASGFASAAINLTADPPAPGFPEIHVTDATVFGNVIHSLVQDRMLRQTFNNPATFDIGEIIISLNLNGTDGTANEGAGEGGLVLNLYTVDDVNGANWTAAGPSASPIRTWTVPQTTSIPETSGRLSIGFTGGDVFTLPARDTGTDGYGLEIQSVDGVTALGGWHVTPADEVDRYLNGVFYREDGTVSRTYRDAGLSLFEVGATPPAPGDVTGDGQVLVEDFNVISANLRNVVGARTQGDLTGDGNVNFEDFREWKANFTPAAPAGTAIPEPTTLAACGLAILALPLIRRRKALPLALVAALLAATLPAAQAVVTIDATQAAWPTVDVEVETVDSLTVPSQTGGRGVTGTRQLRQTFRVDNTFNVGGIFLAWDANGNDGGIVFDFYEVADVNANTFTPLGDSLKTIIIPTSVDIPAAANDYMLFNLTAFDVFTLTANTPEGADGYAFEVSNFDETTNLGNLVHSNDGTDYYELGKFYTESGGASGGGSSGRDLSLALISTTEVPPLTGDTEPDGDVDLDDLATIRANFFMTNAGPTDGDFNGDTVVSFEDFELWKRNRTAAVPSSGAVPEPTAAVLALAGSAGLFGRRRRNV